MNAIIPPGDQDIIIAGGLITSPAWASWLAQFNTVLTTITLCIGVGAWRYTSVAGLSPAVTA